jgi:hypothetical protein
MTNKDRLAWTEKTKCLNQDRELARGMQVKDAWGNRGIVVKIEIPDEPSVENHGTVFVWQSERTGYGDDNCEHYTYTSWKEFLRIED